MKNNKYKLLHIILPSSLAVRSAVIPEVQLGSIDLQEPMNTRNMKQDGVLTALAGLAGLAGWLG